MIVLPYEKEPIDLLIENYATYPHNPGTSLEELEILFPLGEHTSIPVRFQYCAKGEALLGIDDRLYVARLESVKFENKPTPGWVSVYSVEVEWA